MRPAWLAVLALLLPVPARAQDVPAPPPAYASASIGLDLVLEPLVIAAEADLGNGEIVMALARTQVVLASAPASSSVHVRAEGLSLLARQRLGDTPPGTVDASAAYEPLVTTATQDVASGRTDLARARAEWVSAHVPSGSPLALRAQALIGAIAQRAAAPPVIVVSQSTWVPPERPEAPPADPVASHHRPRRRSDVEIVDLYITSGLSGAFFGAWITEGSGAIDHSSSDDQSRILSVAMLAGAGVMTLGTFALDQIDDGPRAGQPGAIAAGIRFGFVLSGLSLGLWSADHSTDNAISFGALGIGILGGAAIGTIFAYVAEPHPSQVQFTQSTGLWGGILGGELAALVAPLAFPNLGAGTDRTQAGFGITLGGLSVGLLTGVVLSAAHENFSARRSWLTSLGLIAGTGAGTLVWLLVSAASRWTFDFPTWGGISGVGGLGGLILAAALTDGDHNTRNWDEEPPVQLSLSPTVGGATVGVNGSF